MKSRSSRRRRGAVANSHGKVPVLWSCQSRSSRRCGAVAIPLLGVGLGRVDGVVAFFEATRSRCHAVAIVIRPRTPHVAFFEATRSRCHSARMLHVQALAATMSRSSRRRGAVAIRDLDAIAARAEAVAFFEATRSRCHVLFGVLERGTYPVAFFEATRSRCHEPAVGVINYVVVVAFFEATRSRCHIASLPRGAWREAVAFFEATRSRCHLLGKLATEFINHVAFFEATRSRCHSTARRRSRSGWCSRVLRGDAEPLPCHGGTVLALEPMLSRSSRRRGAVAMTHRCEDDRGVHACRVLRGDAEPLPLRAPVFTGYGPHCRVLRGDAEPLPCAAAGCGTTSPRGRVLRGDAEPLPSPSGRRHGSRARSRVLRGDAEPLPFDEALALTDPRLYVAFFEATRSRCHPYNRRWQGLA